MNCLTNIIINFVLDYLLTWNETILLLDICGENFESVIIETGIFYTEWSLRYIVCYKPKRRALRRRVQRQFSWTWSARSRNPRTFTTVHSWHFTLTSVSEYSLFVWSHKFTLIYATAMKCSVSIKSYQSFRSPHSSQKREQKNTSRVRLKLIEFTSQRKCQYSPCCWEFLKVPSISCCTADIYL